MDQGRGINRGNPMTTHQIVTTAKIYRKLEREYRLAGDPVNADKAAAMYRKLERELKHRLNED